MSETGELPLEEPKSGKKPHELTTGQVMDMIETKWGDRGEHIVLFDVPDRVGMKQRRRADVIAISMWQKSNYVIHGAEIKVSRGDWLRELKQTSKSDPFLPHVDRWWLITGNVTVAKPEEIPDYWGWMNATATGLRIMRPARAIESTENKVFMNRDWAYGLIQRAHRASGEELSRQVAKGIEVQLKVETARLEREYAGRNRDYFKSEYESLKAKVDAAQAASGLELDSWRFGNPTTVGQLAKALHQLQGTGYSSARSEFERHIANYQSLIKRTQEVLEAMNLPPHAKGDI